MVTRSVVKLSGHELFRYRLVLATLTGNSVVIEDIRPDGDFTGQVGVNAAEIRFMKLLEALTNGSVFDISYTGTSISYKPGALMGGRLEFDCELDKSIGYFLEPILALAPFTKNPINIQLYGITNDEQCITVDLIRTVLLPQLTRYGLEGTIELQIKRRGARPNGGGHVQFKCANTRTLKSIQFTDEGRIRKIRGVAYAARVSPQNSNRMVESSRVLLNKFIPDVYIYSDVYKGVESGKSAGYGLSLVAESTSGALICAENMALAGQTPEDVGLRAAKLLYNEISRGGCVDSKSQWLNLLLMAFGPEDVSKIRVGSELTKLTIAFLRDLKELTGVQFKIVRDKSSDTILMSCVGIGFINYAKKAT
ncbi:hypothetical protein MIR68_004544 [Amoeboaphelidium protococcarum]|nr:hypothetical protein MIR68_004544 [Amoeboaphelidium protococcarum]